MLLFAGLGNPDQKYNKNRHNVGFNFIDFVNEKNVYKKKFDSLFSELLIYNHKIYLCKPMTFMNLSGNAISKFKRFYQIKNKDIYIFHDDLDLEIGKIKVKSGGSSGGHNGVDSISRKIGNEFNRIRIGIGHPGDKKYVENYVLSDFKKKENNLIDECFLKIKKNINSIINKNFNEFSSKVNNI